MDKKILKFTEKINKDLKKLRKQLKIEKLEVDAMKDPVVSSFLDEINRKQEEIEELTRYLSMQSPEITKKIGEISDLKVLLSEQKAYKKYLKALKRYNKYIDMINEEIFSL